MAKAKVRAEMKRGELGIKATVRLRHPAAMQEMSTARKGRNEATTRRTSQLSLLTSRRSVSGRERSAKKRLTTVCSARTRQ